jgi:hypothetical protein
MNMSDTVLTQPVELSYDELDAVSAGVMALKQENPILVVVTELKRLQQSIISDLCGRGLREVAF